ncbi:MAG: hypothetical protein IT510_02820 [Sulfuritalea sp.]|nr:hypothetical protein [Sulfuritalea sp.]
MVFALSLAGTYHGQGRKLDESIGRDILAMTAAACDRLEAKRRRDAAIVQAWELVGIGTTPKSVTKILNDFHATTWPRWRFAGLPANSTNLQRALFDAFRFAAAIPKANGAIDMPSSSRHIARILGHRASAMSTAPAHSGDTTKQGDSNEFVR